ncbi:hypothetical protein [Streptomyces sp. NPDC014685]|uniref:hypothetical protein n=1 Tax=Streptomyces sp. NPDC014685 TaxID=3364881 RepID=UPI0036F76F32
MTYAVRKAPVRDELADLDLLAAARGRVKRLVGLLETLPFAERTVCIAREYLDEAVLVQGAFERWARLDQAEQQRLLRLWQQGVS